MLKLIAVPLGGSAAPQILKEAAAYTYDEAMLVTSSRSLVQEARAAGVNAANFDYLANDILRQMGRTNLRLLSRKGQELIIEERIEQLAQRGVVTYYAKLLGKKGFLKAIVALISQLSRSCIDEEDLAPGSSNSEKYQVVDIILNQWSREAGLQLKDAEICAIYSLYRNYLYEKGLYDVEGLYRLTIAELKGNQSSLKWKHLYFNGFYSFDALQLEIIKALSRRLEVTVGLTYEVSSLPPEEQDKHDGLFEISKTAYWDLVGMSNCELEPCQATGLGREPVLEGLLKNLRRDNTLGEITELPLPKGLVCNPGVEPLLRELTAAGATLAEAVQEGLTDQDRRLYYAAEGKIALWEFTDRQEEMQGVLRQAKGQLQAGVKPERIAIVLRKMEDYTGFAALCQDYGLPCRLPHTAQLVGNPIYEYVQMLLQTGLGYGAKQAAALQAFLTHPLQAALLGLDTAAISKLPQEKYYTVATELFKAVEDCHQLQEGETNPRLILLKKYWQALPGKALISEYCAWVQGLLQELQLPKEMGRQYREQGLDLRSLKNLTLGAQALQEVVGGLPIPYRESGFDKRKIELQEFMDLLQEAAEGKTIALKNGNTQGINIVAATNLEEAAYDYVYILGLREKEFPYLKNESWLYNDLERADLRALGLDLPGSLESLQEDAHFWAKACSAATKGLVATYFKDDQNGASIYVTELLNLYGKSIFMDTKALEAAGILPTTPSTGYSTRELKGILAQDSLLSTLEPLASKGQLAAAKADIARLQGQQVYNGQLQQPRLREQAFRRIGKGFSVSRLEGYLSCPFKFMANQIWQQWEEKDLDGGLKPDVRGNLLHQVLERFIGNHLQQTLRQEQLRELQQELQQVFEESCDELISQGQIYDNEFWVYEKALLLKQLLRWLKAEISYGDQWSYRPQLLEHSFGGKQAPEDALSLTLGDNTISLQGRIDRIDADGNKFYITDYKSGSTPEDKSFLVTDLQTPLYMMAAQANLAKTNPQAQVTGGGYYSIKTAQRKSSFAFPDYTGTIGFKTHSDKLDPIENMEQLAARASELVEAELIAMEQGEFKPTPENGDCTYCPIADACRTRLLADATATVGEPLQLPPTKEDQGEAMPLAAAKAEKRVTFGANPEQEQAAYCFDYNVSLSAGAGSGKTKVLVDRFINLLAHGNGLDAEAPVGQALEDTALYKYCRYNGLLEGDEARQAQALAKAKAKALELRALPLEDKRRLKASDIVAITFTRKAAQELRERLVARLNEQITQSPQGSFAKRLWQRQLASLDLAQIGTIHSLCSTLLKNNPVEAELDPSFALMDEADGERFMAEEAEAYIRQRLSDGDSEVMALCTEYGSRGFMAQALELIKGGELPSPEEDLTLPYQSVLDQVQEAVDFLREGLQDDFGGEIKGANAKHIADKAALEQALTNYEDPESIALLRSSFNKLVARKEVKELVGEIKERVGLLLAAPLCKRAAPLATAWQGFLQGLVAHIRKQRLLINQLSYDDLEKMAVELLENNSAVAAKAGERYKYLMVDEFQDTNDRQRRLIYLLCGGSSQELRGNRLFIVGDGKQSIYRFRGADVSVFDRVRREIAAGAPVSTSGSALVLDKKMGTNFRSDASILNLCNGLFEPLMGTSTDQSVYFEPLRVGKAKQKNLLPELYLFSYPKGSKDLSRAAEANLVVKRIRELHAEGYAYDKMAILLAKATNVGYFTKALQQAGLPYKLTNGKGFYERLEIVDLINFFKFLLRPQEDKALIGILRSPFFGINDETITELYLRGNQRGGSLWEALKANTNDPAEQQGGEAPRTKQGATPGGLREQQELLLRAVHILEELLPKAQYLNLPDLCNALDAALEPETVLPLQPEGLEKIANWNKLMQMAKAYAATEQGTSLSWLNRICQLRADQVREGAAVARVDNAVEIMTVHKSKGLERKVVFLPFLGDRPLPDTSTIKYIPKMGLGISLDVNEEKLWKTPVLEKLKAFNKEMEQAEGLRQLYVAITRAEERLILVGSDQGTREVSWLNTIKPLLPECTELLTLEELELDQLPTLIAAPKEQAEQALTPEALRQLEPLPDFDKPNQQFFTASALQDYEYCPRSYYYHYVEHLPGLEESLPDAIRALPATELGQIVHTALERYSAKRNNFEEAYSYAVQEFAGGDFDLAAPARAMLEKYIASPIYKDFEALPRHTEFAFQLALASGEPGQSPQEYIFSGFIDVLAENPDGSLSIIDYKSGKPPENKGPKKGYAYQLAIYAAAAAKRFGKPVTSCALHFLRNASEWKLPKEDWQGELLALCREISSKNGEADFDCRLEGCQHCTYRYLCKQK